jgi:GDP-D-mannose dehydratase
MKRKKAIIFGISGQDGAYLSNFLLKKIMKFLAQQEINLKKIFLDLKN